MVFEEKILFLGMTYSGMYKLVKTHIYCPPPGLFYRFLMTALTSKKFAAAAVGGGRAESPLQRIFFPFSSKMERFAALKRSTSKSPRSFF